MWATSRGNRSALQFVPSNVGPGDTLCTRDVRCILNMQSAREGCTDLPGSASP